MRGRCAKLEMKLIYTIIILSLTFLSCKKHRSNEIKKLSFAVAGCYGKCPVLAIEIDSSLTYKFYGGENTNKKGFYKGLVTKGFWDTLNLKFEQIRFKHLDTLYNYSVDDMPIELYLTIGKDRKPLFGQDESMPDSVRKVLYWVLNSYKNINLIQVDTLAFETSIQYGIGPIPAPKILKFTAPKIVE